MLTTLACNNKERYLETKDFCGALTLLSYDFSELTNKQHVIGFILSQEAEELAPFLKEVAKNGQDHLCRDGTKVSAESLKTLFEVFDESVSTKKAIAVW